MYLYSPCDVYRSWKVKADPIKSSTILELRTCMQNSVLPSSRTAEELIGWGLTWCSSVLELTLKCLTHDLQELSLSSTLEGLAEVGRKTNKLGRSTFHTSLVDFYPWPASQCHAQCSSRESTKSRTSCLEQPETLHVSSIMYEATIMQKCGSDTESFWLWGSFPTLPLSGKYGILSLSCGVTASHGYTISVYLI